MGTFWYRLWLRLTDQPNALQQHQMDCNESRCQPWTQAEADRVEHFRQKRDGRP
jgi:hypothetical protein